MKLKIDIPQSFGRMSYIVPVRELLDFEKSEIVDEIFFFSSAVLGFGSDLQVFKF